MAGSELYKKGRPCVGVPIVCQSMMTASKVFAEFRAEKAVAKPLTA